jgi:hypothetical protein
MLVMMSITIVLYTTVIADKSTVQGLLAFTHIPNFIAPFLTIAFTQLCGVAITTTTNIKTKNDMIALKIDLIHTYKKMKTKMNFR